MGQNLDYLMYVNQVLGVNKIINQESLTIDKSSISLFYDINKSAIQIENLKDIELVFVNLSLDITDSLFSKEHVSLFQKMKSAMKIEKIKSIEIETQTQDLNTILLDLSKNSSLKFVVVFTNQPSSKHKISNFGSFSFIETFSPALLNKNTNLKKQAWEDLQQVMGYFSC